MFGNSLLFVSLDFSTREWIKYFSKTNRIKSAIFEIFISRSGGVNISSQIYVNGFYDGGNYSKVKEAVLKSKQLLVKQC